MANDIYTATGCARCRIAKRFMKENGVDYNEHDINAEGNIGNSVLHFANSAFHRQWLKIMRIFLTVVDKMTIAALQRETIRQFVKPVDDIDDRHVNHAISEIAQRFSPLHLIMWIYS